MPGGPLCCEALSLPIPRGFLTHFSLWLPLFYFAVSSSSRFFWFSTGLPVLIFLFSLILWKIIYIPFFLLILEFVYLIFNFQDYFPFHNHLFTFYRYNLFSYLLTHLYESFKAPLTISVFCGTSQTAKLSTSGRISTASLYSANAPSNMTFYLGLPSQLYYKMDLGLLLKIK